MGSPHKPMPGPATRKRPSAASRTERLSTTHKPAGKSDFRSRPLAERPRERLAFLGPEQLRDEELVALVFGSGATLTAARRLIEEAGGMHALRRLGVDALCQLPGVGPARAAQLKAALELGRRALQPEPLFDLFIGQATDVAHVLQLELSPGEQEAVHVLGLDARHRVRSRHIAALGQVDRVQVCPSDVFRPLVREGLVATVIAHNHPSGDPLPSREDELLTRRLVQVGQLLGVMLLDHIIVAQSGYYSFAEHGQIASALALASPLGERGGRAAEAAAETPGRRPGSTRRPAGCSARPTRRPSPA